MTRVVDTVAWLQQELQQFDLEVCKEQLLSNWQHFVLWAKQRAESAVDDPSKLIDDTMYRVRNVTWEEIQLGIVFLFFWYMWQSFWETVADGGGLQKWTFNTVLHYAKKVPPVSTYVAKELQKSKDEMEKNAKHDPNAIRAIPSKGWSRKDALQVIEKKVAEDCDWKGGKAFGYVYHGDEEHCTFLNKVYSMYCHANPLHASAFPSCIKMEAEVVAMTASMLGGNEQTCGTMTSGGTESIELACLAARNYGRAVLGVKKPEMVVPTSIHAAFAKSCHYFGIRLVTVPCDPVTRRAVPKAMERAITKNTVMMVGSTPSYPHGVIDPVEEIAAIARKHNIWMHIDGCLGGFMLPWLKKLGYNIPNFDIGIDGVMSMSADTHKYGYGSKGTSVILHRNREFRAFQFYTWADWPGGLFGSPTLAGSRPGGLIATAWASLMTMGEDGFLELADKIMKTALKVKEGINQVDGLQVLGDPDMTGMAFEATAKDVDIFLLSEALEKRGWHLEKQQFPNSLHMSVTNRHIGIVDKFVHDLRECVAEVRGKKPTGVAAVYGGAVHVPDRSLVEHVIKEYLGRLYDL